MFYAKITRNKFDAPTVGAVDGKPQNFDVRAFESIAERQKAIDQAWDEGGNGYKCSRRQVERYFGRDFRVLSSGLCIAESDYWIHVEHATVPNF